MKLQVFLSSKMRRNVLRAERAAAQRIIETTELWNCWNWERSATAGPYPPMDLCLDEVKKSDALVLVLGRDLTDHTRQEYELAADLPIRRYIFVKKGELLPHTRQFLKDVQSDNTYRWFGNVGELETMIKESLTMDMIRGYRSLSGQSAIGSPGTVLPVVPYPRRAM